MGRTEEWDAGADPARGHDLVNADNAQAQGNPQLFQNNTVTVMQKVAGDLPKWLAAWRQITPIEVL